ncbi:MAG: hypothetical protein GXP38_01630 [Chloroflexi bacterium]|nr:hypothetical protein [Chloroflexota bacterium]
MNAVTSPQLHVASFLIRLRWEDSAEQSFHGEIEHIQSGERWTFHSLSDIQTLIEETIGQSDQPAPPDPSS